MTWWRGTRRWRDSTARRGSSTRRSWPRGTLRLNC
ncbi:hypothetical protein E2C01_095636 [Portunus trituberculatus]|uniref:Uncharacterized protein n=1 Tax=Portunus trituberculatus TaxID=210409 RepID=A0A5B7JZC7_PORTR|nr:hypothetical protein [Portunus trituberculatus]